MWPLILRFAGNCRGVHGRWVWKSKLENPPYDFHGAFRTLSENTAQMVLVLSSPFFSNFRALIAELAIQHGLPTMFIFASSRRVNSCRTAQTPAANFRQGASTGENTQQREASRSAN